MASDYSTNEWKQLTKTNHSTIFVGQVIGEGVSEIRRKLVVSSQGAVIWWGCGKDDVRAELDRVRLEY